MIYGEYNHFGYTVYELEDGGQSREIYYAGNHALDSGVGQSVSLDHPFALTLEEIREDCYETVLEMAEESGEDIGDITRIPDSEEE